MNKDDPLSLKWENIGLNLKGCILSVSSINHCFTS